MKNCFKFKWVFSHLIEGIKLQKENKPEQTVVEIPETVSNWFWCHKQKSRNHLKLLPVKQKYPETNVLSVVDIPWNCIDQVYSIAAATAL